MQQALLQINLFPAQTDQFANTKAMTIGQQDQSRITMPVPPYSAGGTHKLVDFIFGEVFAAAVIDVLQAQLNFPIYSYWRCLDGELQNRIGTGCHCENSPYIGSYTESSPTPSAPSSPHNLPSSTNSRSGIFRSLHLQSMRAELQVSVVKYRTTSTIANVSRS